MDKYRFIQVSWKGPTGGRKDAGYGCQQAAWMESDFLLSHLVIKIRFLKIFKGMNEQIYSLIEQKAG
ncbi:hypothetical protein [Qiania dongpingensis]|uniref:Uncharacterized protein n=1 Tax=Qiania dongpingensis TaxID=2763669 RepID=A0A7G9G2G6_9FIRM|nr:hypothetical protein [Qiania dongpingensis]QNM04998.1 hypothetical protein H9Q78_11150 [Qiania dongpingensis]